MEAYLDKVRAIISSIAGTVARECPVGMVHSTAEF